MNPIYKKDGVFLVLQAEQFYTFSQGISITEEMRQNKPQFCAYWYDKLADRLHAWPLAKVAETSDSEVSIQPQIGRPLRFVYMTKLVYDTHIRQKGILQEDKAPELPSDEAVQQHMMSINAYS